MTAADIGSTPVPRPRRRWSLRSRIALFLAVLLLPIAVVEGALRPFVHVGGAVFVDRHGAAVTAIDTSGGYPRPRALLRGRLEAGEFSTAIATDADGHRCSAATAVDGAVDLGRGPGIELIAVGDSFTFGWGVEFEQTFGALLAAAVRDRVEPVPVRLTNLACPGTGLHSQRLGLEEYLAQPAQGWRRLVVWTLLLEHGLASGNDLIDNHNSLSGGAGDGGEHLTAEARRDQGESPGVLLRLKQFLSHWSVGYQLAMRTCGSSLRQLAPRHHDAATEALLVTAWAEFSDELRAAQALSLRQDVPMLFGYMPYQREIAADDESVFARLRRVLPSALPLVSLLPQLRACRQDWCFPCDGHPTAAGHTAICHAYWPGVAKVVDDLRTGIGR